MGGAGSNMAQVDKDRLYTDVTYRFTYVASFLGFKEDDAAALKASAPLVAPLVPTIVDAVYDKLFSFDITKVRITEINDNNFVWYCRHAHGDTEAFP